MSEILETKMTCPLGSECEEIRDNQKHQCRWLVTLVNRVDKQKPVDEKKCAVTWQPILMAESIGGQAKQQYALETMREETIKRQDAALAKMVSPTPHQVKPLIEE